MGSEQSSDDEAGGQPEASPDVPESGQPPRDERLAGFARDGEWDASRPGPELTKVLADVAGPEWRCSGATADELFGLLRRLVAVESWLAAGKLGILRALIREHDLPFIDQPRHGDLPDKWEQSLTRQVSLALAVSAPSADRLMLSAWEMEARLPGVAALLEDGTLSYPKARLIAEAFRFLSDEDAATAEQMILPELTGPTGLTWGQIERLATLAAVTVDPDSAERRRNAAQKYGARVSVFREDAGTAALSGRDLPPDETLAAYANVCARAAEYKESGAFTGWQMDQYRAQAYLDLINDIPAHDRIAWAKATGAEGPGLGPGDDEFPLWPAGDDPDPDDPDDGGPDDGGPDDGGPDDGGPDDGGPGPAEDPTGGMDHCAGDRLDDDYDSGSTDGGDSGDHHPGPGVPPWRPDLTLPLATILGLASRPGEGHTLGTFDPSLGRHLAEVAIGSPHTTVCVTVTGPGGIAIGHSCARNGKSAPRTGLPPPRGTLPARLNLTIPATLLLDLAARGGASYQGWALIPRTPRDGNAADPGNWTLALPSGLEYDLRLIAVPTYDCDHAHESHAYQPNDTLRHLVQIRDGTCTFPTCNRHARESDFEHAVPYHQGGRTCACKCDARSHMLRVNSQIGGLACKPAA